jgi:uncharacterized protein DUF4157
MRDGSGVSAPTASVGESVPDATRTPTAPAHRASDHPGLAIDPPGGVLEREADRAAAELTRAPASSGRERRRVQTKSRKANDTMSVAAPPIVHDALATPGRPLDAATRSFMETRFGEDFGRVRVHTGGKAADSANAVDALAYTAGQDVVFAAGRYAPGTAAGDRLLAHELTHTLQQRADTCAVQRSLKFEIQTNNHVWAVKNTGDPDPRLLPRKYAPTTVGYEEGAGQERGDKPAYLSVGLKGGPARRKGYALVEAEGELTTEEVTSQAAAKKDAQFVREYRFTTQVRLRDIRDKRVRAGQLVLLREIDNAKLPSKRGKFARDTFEFRYFNADGTRLDVHLSEDGRLKDGSVKLMKVGREERRDIDEAKSAQYVETWKVTEVAGGPVDFLGKRARVERVDVVDNATDPGMRGKFNPRTWQRNYFRPADLKGTKPGPSAKPLDVHMDADGRLQAGRVTFLVRKELAAKEQTAIELQSEHLGVLEFETPKWFREWPEIKERIQEAVDMTKAFNAQRGTAAEVKDKTTLNAIAARKEKTAPLGRVVEWPGGTPHLTNLLRDKRRLLVQIADAEWFARIQASEAIPISQYESLLKEHEESWVRDIVVPGADNILRGALNVAKPKLAAVDPSLVVNLRGFLQLILTYILRGQVTPSKPSKSSFFLMSRTHFGSLYRQLLSADEKALFKAIAGSPSKPSDNPILGELETPINAWRTKAKLSHVTLTRKTLFFRTFGPAIYEWLANIPKGTDLLSGKADDLSDAMGAKFVPTKPGNKDFRRAQFEVRGTMSHGTVKRRPDGTFSQLGNDKKAGEWVSFAKAIFDAAKVRAADTPDDPRTPGVDESSKTGLKG